MPLSHSGGRSANDTERMQGHREVGSGFSSTANSKAARRAKLQLERLEALEQLALRRIALEKQQQEAELKFMRLKLEHTEKFDRLRRRIELDDKADDRWTNRNTTSRSSTGMATAAGQYTGATAASYEDARQDGISDDGLLRTLAGITVDQSAVEPSYVGTVGRAEQVAVSTAERDEVVPHLGSSVLNECYVDSSSLPEPTTDKQYPLSISSRSDGIQNVLTSSPKNIAQSLVVSSTIPSSDSVRMTRSIPNGRTGGQSSLLLHHLERQTARVAALPHSVESIPGQPGASQWESTPSKVTAGQVMSEEQFDYEEVPARVGEGDPASEKCLQLDKRKMDSATDQKTRAMPASVTSLSTSTDPFLGQSVISRAGVIVPTMISANQQEPAAPKGWPMSRKLVVRHGMSRIFSVFTGKEDEWSRRVSVNSFRGFHLRLLLYNSREDLIRVEECHLDTAECLKLDKIGMEERVFGTAGKPEAYMFTYSSVVATDVEHPTKRHALRVVTTSIDSTSGPSFRLIRGKIMIQNLCWARTGWEQLILETILERWKRWMIYVHIEKAMASSSTKWMEVAHTFHRVDIDSRDTIISALTKVVKRILEPDPFTGGRMLRRVTASTNVP